MAIFQKLKGTAGELLDNGKYNDICKTVGVEGANMLIQSRLQERNITIPEWKNYREVREKLHSNPLNLGPVVKKLKNDADDFLGLDPISE